MQLLLLACLFVFVFFSESCGFQLSGLPHLGFQPFEVVIFQIINFHLLGFRQVGLQHSGVCLLGLQPVLQLDRHKNLMSCMVGGCWTCREQVSGWKGQSFRWEELEEQLGGCV